MLENVVCLVSDIPRRITSTFVLLKGKLGLKGAYWIVQRFLVHYQILNLSNIATAILFFFCIASCKLIALPTIATAIVVALKGVSKK